MQPLCALLQLDKNPLIHFRGIVETNLETDTVGIYTVFRKNTHSCFVLYLHGKCSDFHKIFGECLGGNTHSTGKK